MQNIAKLGLLGNESCNLSEYPSEWDITPRQYYCLCNAYVFSHVKHLRQVNENLFVNLNFTHQSYTF